MTSESDTKYIHILEDALLFAREKNQPHQWRDTGVTITTAEPFKEKRCVVCGAINWGGVENDVCFGDNRVELAITKANNRRAARLWGGQDERG